MKEHYFKRVSQVTPTRFWINNVTRTQADMSLEEGAVGCTQNPSYTWKMLTHPEEGEYAKGLLKEIMKEEKDDTMALVKLQRELVSGVAKRFLPLYEASNHQLGYVSIQGDPFHEDADTILKMARFNREAGPNIMAKIPTTEDGLKAIAIVAKEGIPINCTECMAVQQVIDACETYIEATKDLEHPAPMYFSLITGIFDEYLQNEVKEKNIAISPDTLWQAGIAVAKKVHAVVNDRKYPCGFIGGGARGLQHFTEMVGANANITINWDGTADKLIEQDPVVVSRFLQPTPYLVEDELLNTLETFRKAYIIGAITPQEYEGYGPVVLFRSSFEDAWGKALEMITSLR